VPNLNVWAREFHRMKSEKTELRDHGWGRLCEEAGKMGQMVPYGLIRKAGLRTSSVLEHPQGGGKENIP